MSDKNSIDNPLTLTVGDEQLVIRRSYEVISIINDFFIASWVPFGECVFSLSVDGKSSYLAIYHWQCSIFDPTNNTSIGTSSYATSAR
jgi:hypothetical protein